jgi:CheY-like chemotaxis protein
MLKTGPIVIVEDDADDQHLMQEALQSLYLANPILFFSQGSTALQYLKTSADEPFIILCDINMPGMNGLEFLNKVHTELPSHRRSIPFIFFSTSATPDAMQKAYSMHVQGFFVKPHAMADTKRVLQLIINYWQICRHPNNKDVRQPWHH